MIKSFSYQPTSAKTASSAITSIVTENKQARIKITHNKDYNPHAYAIGFGNIYDSSLIIGGISESDNFSQDLLISFAQLLSRAITDNEPLAIINVKRLLEKKGVWIIPSFRSVEKPSLAMNFISEKLSPKRLLELNTTGVGIQYCSPKINEANARLFAYLLSSSSGYNSCKEPPPENSLCHWFCGEFLKPAFSICPDVPLQGNTPDIEYLLTIFLETFLIFISA